MSDLTGQSLGRYHILEPLGEGGMAVVYKAYDTRLETEVAVKVIRTEELPPKVMERALKRFEREAKALARLTHSNIVKVTDFGEHEGRPYLVMEYLPSGTLKSRLTGRPMPWQEAVKLLVPVARALDFAHRQGMIHRDVKPSNILITADGDPMLTDFGIAKIIEEEGTLDLTGTSAAVGTPEYMAPEQAVARSVDHRADIYALGVVLYEMVVGRKPYTADTPMAVMIMHARDPLPRPRSFVPSLPQEVENVLLKALAKKPEDRYEDMGRMAQALEGLLSGRVKAAQPEPVRKPQPKLEETHETIEQRKAIPEAKLEKSGKAKKFALSPLVMGLGVVGIAVLVPLMLLAAELLRGLPLSPTTAVQAGVTEPSAGVDQSTQMTPLPRYEIQTEGFPSLGPPDAPITIVQFADYQCPFCRRFHQETYRSLMDAYPGRIRFVFRNFPLTSIHPEAFPAAVAAACAGEQDSFWPYHDKLFSSDQLGREVYLQYATDLRLDMTIFRECLDSGRHDDAINADAEYATNIGVNSTPTFLINGIALVGAQPLDVFIQVIDEELAGGSAP